MRHDDADDHRREPPHDRWCISLTTAQPCDCERAPHRQTHLRPDPTPQARLIALVGKLRGIIEGFQAEALDGVICTPDDGNDGFPLWDAPPSRNWCSRCRARWATLFALPDELEAALLTQTAERPRLTTEKTVQEFQSRVARAMEREQEDHASTIPQASTWPENEDGSALARLRAIILDFKVGTYARSNRRAEVREVQTIHKTLNVVLAQIEKLQTAALASPPVDPRHREKIGECMGLSENIIVMPKGQ